MHNINLCEDMLTIFIFISVNFCDDDTSVCMYITNIL